MGLFCITMLRLIFISDTHSLHNLMYYSLDDFKSDDYKNILIHSGDISNIGKLEELVEFITWFKDLEGFDKKIFIAGNHDLLLEYPTPELNVLIDKNNLLDSNVIYLQDSSYDYYNEILSRPLKIYGSPWQPKFGNWAFNLSRYSDELLNTWNNIPNDTDILITHTPPHNKLDYNNYGEPCGCEFLRNRVLDIKPLVHCFGHIHESYGVALINEVAYINSSICDGHYRPHNKPIILDLSEENNKMIVNYVEK